MQILKNDFTSRHGTEKVVTVTVQLQIVRHYLHNTGGIV